MWQMHVRLGVVCLFFFFFQAEDGIRDLVRSRGLGDVYKRQVPVIEMNGEPFVMPPMLFRQADPDHLRTHAEKRDLVDRSQKYELVPFEGCLLYTSDAADERSSVDLGGRRIIKKKK